MKFPECNYMNIFSGVYNQCSIMSQQSCKSKESIINFFSFYFCWLNSILWIFIPLSILLIYIIFRFISSIVEDYLAPSITGISSFLKLSDSLAAVTLLAFANGAGDVITAFVVSDTDEAISYNIGALFGAGLFVCSLVVAITILKSKEKINIDPSIIYRDIGIYIIATLMTFTFAFIGTLNLFSAFFMLFLYLILVLIVVIQDYYKSYKNKEEKKNLISNNFNEINSSQIIEEKYNKREIKEFKEEEEEDNEFNFNKKKKNEIMFTKTNESVIIAENIQKTKSYRENLSYNFKVAIDLLTKLQMKNGLEEKSFKNFTILEKFNFIIDFPFNIIKGLTIPPADIDNYDKRYTYLWPFFGIPFIFIVLFSPSIYSIYIGIPLILITFLFFFITQYSNSPIKAPKYFAFIQFISAFQAIIWTYLASAILIDLLQMIAIISKMKPAFLGLTIIAVGNALPDAFTTIALSKQGFASMGLTGAYSGQLFGLLIGFGLSLLKKVALKGDQKFNLFIKPKINSLEITVIVVSFVNLCFTFFYGIYSKYTFENLLAKCLIGIYSCFILSAVIFQIIYLI